MQVAAMAGREPGTLLKTIGALTRPRGFESHALARPRKTSTDLRLCSFISDRRLIGARSQMQPTAAMCRWSRIYATWILKCFPRSPWKNRRGSADREALGHPHGWPSAWLTRSDLDGNRPQPPVGGRVRLPHAERALPKGAAA